MTTIALERANFILGEEIRIRPDRELGAWSGEATVNTFRGRLHIDSKNNVIKATHENGFTTLSPSDICFALKDGSGKNVRVTNQCVRVNVTTPEVRLTPDSEAVSATGGSGRILIQAASPEQFSLGGAPEWVKLTRENRELGPSVHYDVAANQSYQLRSAAIKIGDAVFDLTQWGSPYVPIPYVADFAQPPIPIWEMSDRELKTGRSHDAPPRWIIDNQPGEVATARVAPEGPSGKGALILERTIPADEAWKTLLVLPGVMTQAGGKYSGSVWVKADSAVAIGLEFGQRTAPYGSCGMYRHVSVSENWQEIKFRFTAGSASCGPANNRFVIHCGNVAGKLWISDFTLTRE